MFLLYHTRQIDEDYYDSKVIGIYTTEEKVYSVIEKFKTLPGFSQHIDGFYVCNFPKVDRYIKRNKYVYLLIGEKAVDETDSNTMFYDLFSNKFNALISLLSKKCICFKHKYHYTIGRYTVDEDNWQEGFETFD